VTKLIVDGGAVRGVAALDVRTGAVRAILGRAVILATGGAGKIFPFTTNGNIKTGDGMRSPIARASRSRTWSSRSTTPPDCPAPGS